MSITSSEPVRTPTQRSRRWMLITASIAVALSVLLYWIGLSGRHSVLLGVSLLLISAAIPISGVPAVVRFRRLPYQSRDGARREVSTLSWAIYGNRSTLREPAVRRLHSAGVRACRHAGVDLESGPGRERASQVLGEDVVAFLDDPRATPVDASRMRHYLTAFERLDLRKGLA